VQYSFFLFCFEAGGPSSCIVCHIKCGGCEGTSEEKRFLFYNSTPKVVKCNCKGLLQEEEEGCCTLFYFIYVQMFYKRRRRGLCVTFSGFLTDPPFFLSVGLLGKIFLSHIKRGELLLILGMDRRKVSGHSSPFFSLLNPPYAILFRPKDRQPFGLASSSAYIILVTRGLHHKPIKEIALFFWKKFRRL